jgi:hypothetical protein
MRFRCVLQRSCLRQRVADARVFATTRSGVAPLPEFRATDGSDPSRPLTDAWDWQFRIGFHPGAGSAAGVDFP